MPLHTMLEIVLPVFVIVGLGWALGRWAHFGLGSITTFLLYVAIPALLIDSLAHRAPAPGAFGHVALGAAVVCTLGGIGALIAAKLFSVPTRGAVMSGAFMNAGNFGLPFALLALGEEAVPYAVTFYVTMVVLQNSVGIWIASGKAGGWRETLRLPLLYAAALGLALAWSGTSLPPMLNRPVAMLSSTAIPLMLISLGYSLQAIHAHHLGKALIIATVRIAGGLAVAVVFARLTDLQGPARSALILSGSMPSAVMNVVLANRYKADAKFVASVVLASTVVSLATVPLIILWLA